MKILFSPSESKSKFSSQTTLNSSCFIFNELYKKRLEVLNLYDDFLTHADEKQLCRVFGFKNLPSESSLRQSIFKKGCVKAALRYTGVAYEHLSYSSLDTGAQTWVEQNTLIFSNLFGPLLAGDLVPEYKLRQGEKFCLLSVENFYKEHFSGAIDEFLEGEVVLDLRAGYYEKFYEIKKEHFYFKFIKSGKVVSHYAKAYRGKVLRELAQNDAQNEKDIMELNFTNLRLVDMKKMGLKNELLFEIE